MAEAPPTPRKTPDAREDEKALVARLRAGDERAFEEVVRRYGPRMLAVARRLLRDEDEARDAVQEAFVSAFAAIDRFRGEASLGTWLHRIVVNTALLRLRSRRRRPEEPIEPLLPSFDQEGRLRGPVAPWRPSPLETMEREELRRAVREAIDRLPETHRLVLLLRDIEGLETDEVARLLGIRPQNVKVRVHRARQALRTLLDRKLREEEAA